MTLALSKPVKRVKAPKPLRRSVQGKGLSKVRGRRKKGTTAKRRAERRAETIRLDAAWAKDVREKYGDRCFHYWCVNPATDTHHIVGKKAHPRLRYEVENGAPMCREHHDEAHARPKWFRENFAGWYAERLYGLLGLAK